MILLWVLLSLLAFLAVILLVLLFLPVRLILNSRQSDYRLEWAGIGRASLIPIEKDLLLKLQLAWWRREWPVVEWLAKYKPEKEAPEKKEEQPKAKRRRRKKLFRVSWRLVKNLLQSFKVRRFVLDLDTDDYVVNAYLYPACYWLQAPGRQVRINFRGVNECDIRVENSGIRILWAFVRRAPGKKTPMFKRFADAMRASHTFFYPQTA